MRLDLRKLAHFVAVVQERSMTGAAARLHLTQQALSLSIRALERELGVTLLVRGRGGVELLPAGGSLYADAVHLLAAADAAAERARQVGGSVPELLRIGHTPDVTGVQVITTLAGLPLARAAATTQLVQLLPAELHERLWDRSIDVGLARAMASTDGMARRVVAHHRLRVAVRAGHRLALRTAVTLADIAGETLLVSAPPGVSHDTDLLLDLCRRAGIDPVHRVSPVQGTPPVTAVLGDDGVALVTDEPGPAAGGAVQVVELEPAVTVPLLATWRRDLRGHTRDPLVAPRAG
jgi:DNA-binding transcriptional LysR family regulator